MKAKDKNFGVIILAAGRGTRMGDGEQKVLKKLADKPIINWVIDTVTAISPIEIVLVLGYKSEEVKAVLTDEKIKFVDQKELLGTGHALKIGLEAISRDIEDVLVLFGDDSALYRRETLKDFMVYHQSSRAYATLLTTVYNDPRKLGGLRKDIHNNITGVITLEEMVREGVTNHSVLCGAICFRVSWIRNILDLIPPSGEGGEYLLPKFIEIAARRGEYVNEFELPDSREWASINSPDELAKAQVLKLQLLNERND
jgi:bifunctional N-acetylglucosamine-1-phosphate-uridyltransferase/glucosamine-1-phosphate-acetyltransferase GlmU-like protein